MANIHDILRKIRVEQPIEAATRAEAIRKQGERIDALARMLWGARTSRAQYRGWMLKARAEGNEALEADMCAQERAVNEGALRVIGELCEESLQIVCIALGSNRDASVEARQQVNLARAAFREAALSLIGREGL